MASVSARHTEKYRPVSLLFQFITISVSCLVLGWAMWYPTKTFHSIDEKPSITSLSPSDIKDFGSQPEKIRVGFIINHFNIFDTVKGEFELKGILWFAFDPTQISINMVERCTFEGTKDFERSAARTKLVDDRTLFAWYDIKMSFYMTLQYKYFPYDDHTLYFMLMNAYASPRQMRFIASPLDFNINTSQKSSGWDIFDKNAEDGFIKMQLNQTMKPIDRPVVLFSTGFRRSSIRHSLSIILPILLIFFLSLGAFSIDHILYPESVISLPIGSITGLIAYQFVIQGLSPEVGYFMISDFIFFSVLAAIFVIFFSVLFIGKLTITQKQAFIIFIHTVVDAVLIYFLCFWM